MPFIQNVSMSDITNGFHANAGHNSMCIQIVDPEMEFPAPKNYFTKIHQFKFLDLEDTDDYGHKFKITDEQATELVECLKYALANDMNVIVHCVMGVCRSGAVCEVGTILGFRDTNDYRSPNLLVKHKMMNVLNLLYKDE